MEVSVGEGEGDVGGRVALALANLARAVLQIDVPRAGVLTWNEQRNVKTGPLKQEDPGTRHILDMPQTEQT